MNSDERIWIGPNYGELRIFVLGESWYGDFPDDQATDDGYVPAYLEGGEGPKLAFSRRNFTI